MDESFDELTAAEQHELLEIAEIVTDAIVTAGADWNGKTFIASAALALRDMAAESKYVARALGGRNPLLWLKSKVAVLNRYGLVAASRADLVQAMDQNLVAQSEMSYGRAEYHFLVAVD